MSAEPQVVPVFEKAVVRPRAMTWERGAFGILLYSVLLATSATLLGFAWLTGFMGALGPDYDSGGARWVAVMVAVGWVTTAASAAIGLVAGVRCTRMTGGRGALVGAAGLMVVATGWFAAFLQGFIVLPQVMVIDWMRSAPATGALILLGSGLLSVIVASILWPARVNRMLLGLLAAVFLLGHSAAVFFDVMAWTQTTSSVVAFGVVGWPTIAALLAYGISVEGLFVGHGPGRTSRWLSFAVSALLLSMSLSAVDLAVRTLFALWVN